VKEATSKKQKTTNHIVRLHLYEMFGIDKSIETESKSMIYQGLGSWED
jgi:hypothetical protein